MQIEVVNVLQQPLNGASVRVTKLALTSSLTQHFSTRQSQLEQAAGNSLTRLHDSRIAPASEGVTMVFLWLKALDGRPLSRNAYWLPDRQVSFSCLYLLLQILH